MIFMRWLIIFVFLRNLIDFAIGKFNFRCVGGVSNNDFICQTIADLTDTPLSRMLDTEITSLGTAFLAGLATSTIYYSFCK